MTFEGKGKRKKLLISMGVLAAVVIGAGLGTMTITSYFHPQDPIYRCMDDPAVQSYQLSVPITVTKDGITMLVPKGVGIEGNCIHSVHTLDENLIHVGYNEPYGFTLGHFLYYWIRNDLHKYDTQVYVNGKLHTIGSFLDIPLRQGDSIRIEFTSR